MKVFLLAASMAFSTIAFADPIGPGLPSPNDCKGYGEATDSCNGGVYTLSFSGTPLADVDLLHETYRVTFTMDTSGVTAVVPTATAVDAVSIKVSASTFAFSIYQAPGGVANWSVVPGGIDAGGCSGSGGGFNCADWVAAGVGTPIGGTLTFAFDVTVNNGALNLTAGGASVKARFVNSSGEKVGALLSEPITLQTSNDCVGCDDETVPEPGTWVMLLSGFGLAGLGWKRRQS